MTVQEYISMATTFKVQRKLEISWQNINYPKWSNEKCKMWIKKYYKRDLKEKEFSKLYVANYFNKMNMAWSESTHTHILKYAHSAEYFDCRCQVIKSVSRLLLTWIHVRYEYRWYPCLVTLLWWLNVIIPGRCLALTTLSDCAITTMFRWKELCWRLMINAQVWNIRALISIFSVYLEITGGSDGKESIVNAGDLSLIPGLGRSPEVGNGSPPQYSCLENPINRGA